MKRYTITVQRDGARFSESFNYDMAEELLKFLSHIKNDPMYYISITVNPKNEVVFLKPAGEEQPYIDKFSDPVDLGLTTVRIYAHSMKGHWYVEAEEELDDIAACRAWANWYLNTWPNPMILERRVEIVSPQHEVSYE